MPLVTATDWSEGQTSARDTDDSVVAFTPEEIVIHKSETITVAIGLFNPIEDTGRNVTVDTNFSFPQMLVSNLPQQRYLLPLQQVQIDFDLTAGMDVPFGNLYIHVNITDDDTGEVTSKSMLITVAPYSNLNFGVSGISTFNVEQGARTAVAFNITNDAALDDNITFNLYSSVNWDWGFNMPNATQQFAWHTLQPSDLVYVHLWVEVPHVLDGAPLSGTGPTFTLKAVSGLDRVISEWSFELLFSDFYNASIDRVDEDLGLAPGIDGRLEMEIRNVGNLDSRMAITLEAIDDDGNVLSEFDKADRLEYDGWVMAIFGDYENDPLEPNESRVIEIGFQAPNEYSGEVSVRFHLYAIGGIERSYTHDVRAFIDWQRDAELRLINSDCNYVNPNSTCNADVEIENTGNALDWFTLEVVEQPDYVSSVVIPEDDIPIQNGFKDTIEGIAITVSEDAMAYENDNVTLRFSMPQSGSYAEVKILVKVAPVINWIFEDIVEETDSKGRLSISMTLRNEGNAIDGLTVQLQSSQYTEMGFIPPFIAIYDNSTENPRSFEVHDIPIGYNFTLRAWVDLPQDEMTNGTVWINTTVRSRFLPETPFVHTTQGDYLGIPWQDRPPEDEPFIDFGQLMENAVILFKIWWLYIVAIIFSGAIIYKSIKIREERLEEQALQDALHAPKEQEQAGDWMAKFQGGATQQQQVAQSPQMPAQAFSDVFTAVAGSSTPAATPIPQPLREAATTVLDVHDASAAKGSADQLLGSIQTGGIATPHTANQQFQPSQHHTDMTVRSDPQGLLPSQPVAQATPAPAPTPIPTPAPAVNIPSMVDLDDLDL